MSLLSAKDADDYLQGTVSNLDQDLKVSSLSPASSHIPACPGFVPPFIGYLSLPCPERKG